MNIPPTRDEPLDYGVDFECALERLNQTAGACFRRLAALRASGEATPEQIDAVRQEAEAAQQRAGTLRVGDHAQIAAILAG